MPAVDLTHREAVLVWTLRQIIHNAPRIAPERPTSEDLDECEAWALSYAAWQDARLARACLRFLGIPVEVYH